MVGFVGASGSRSRIRHRRTVGRRISRNYVHGIQNIEPGERVDAGEPVTGIEILVGYHGKGRWALEGLEGWGEMKVKSQKPLSAEDDARAAG